jgi:hypothetical protein
MSVPEITLGVDSPCIITLVDSNNAEVDASAATEILVALTKTDHSAVVGEIYDADDGASGAAWSSGEIAVTFLGADTINAGVTSVISEVKVTGGPAAGSYYGRVFIKCIEGLLNEP